MAVILENTIAAGGGFNQALNAILQLARLSEGNFEYNVLTSHRDNISTLKSLGIRSTIFKRSFLDRVIIILSISPILRHLLRRFKLIGPFEKRLISDGYDIVYFTSPVGRIAALQRLNYILTIWDNCHRDFPEFPEVREYGEFNRREFIFAYINQAYLTLVDSEDLADRLCHRYGVNRGRLLVMPFSPNPLLTHERGADVDSVLRYYHLKPGYLLYPAQFWPHKNHVRIVHALQVLKDQGEMPTVVFVGGNHGNRTHVVSAVTQAGVTNQVHFLGFVTNEHLKALYEGCSAIIMPTYFGPTNIPPLEAWQFGRPIIYSRHLSAQTKDAALLVDPDDPHTIAEAIIKLRNKQISDDLIKRGNERLIELYEMRVISEKTFQKHLLIFDERRKTWPLYKS